MSGNMSVAQGERILDRISQSIGVSQCGKSWVTAALDPFHDAPIEDLTGYPDVEESGSVIQVVKTSYTITVPSGVEGDWDVNICNFPWLGNQGGLEGGGTVPGVFTWGGQTGPTPWGGLMYSAGASGFTSFQGLPSQDFNLDATSTLTYTIGNWRQIATGFEVVNATSELNVQGTVTCYRVPSPERDSKSTWQFFSSSVSGTGEVCIGGCTCVHGIPPPASVAESFLYPGTVQWKAKDGAYVVSTLNSDELAVGEDRTAYIFQLGGTGQWRSRGVTQQIGPVVPGSGGVQFDTWYNGGTMLTDFNYAGAYFSGLSNTSTLQVNLVRYFERFPVVGNVADSQLVVLARPSCKYDPQAIELYSAVIRTMPVGVPQRFNGIGEWFKEAVQSARDVIAPVLSAIPHPFAQAGAGLLKVGGSIGDSYDKKEKKAEARANPPAGRMYDSQGRQSVDVPLQDSRVSEQKMIKKIKNELKNEVASENKVKLKVKKLTAAEKAEYRRLVAKMKQL